MTVTIVEQEWKQTERLMLEQTCGGNLEPFLRDRYPLTVLCYDDLSGVRR
jgi:hypothetical protein